MPLVNTNWLEKNLDKVKIIDCSWHMPETKRNGFKEYQQLHIKNAIFFDLDKNSKTDTDLPHMLTDIKSWEKIVSDMGIKNEDQINEIFAFNLASSFRKSENKDLPIKSSLGKTMSNITGQLNFNQKNLLILVMIFYLIIIWIKLIIIKLIQHSKSIIL